MNQQKSDVRVSKVAMNLEVHVIPVSDVERSKEFYQRLGWRLDEDVAPAKNVRIVQFTPPGSGCSVTAFSAPRPRAVLRHLEIRAADRWKAVLEDADGQDSKLR
jgi:catechol 2,3-dioxygenase-like lactoylglutathione lyase family enzyme